MPEMPMAEMRPPIVVGMRQTRRAMRSSGGIGAPSLEAQAAKTGRLATAARKMRVKAASRMVRAISPGVLRRVAPSMREIMRSRKPAPGPLVTRMTMWSEMTLVPPVTASRSPPDSRITGADSPVTADSSTVAIPSTTCPSAGMTSPGPQTTRSSCARAAALTSSVSPEGRSRLAFVSRRIARSESARAFPWISARPSAKFAKSTVNQSQAAREAKRPSGGPEAAAPPAARNASAAVQ